MKRRIQKIPFGIKVFGLMSSMLVLLIVAGSINYERIKNVSGELVELSDCLVPMEGLIATISGHTLEQQVHVERIWRLSAREPLDEAHVAREWQAFERLGALAKDETLEGDRVLKSALESARSKQDIIDLVRLQFLLGNIGIEHREFHDHVLKIFQHLQEGATDKARQLQDALEKEEDDVQRELETARGAVTKMAKRSARTSAAHEQNILHLNIILIAVAAVIGLLYAAIVAVGLTRPVRALLAGTREVDQGNLEVQLRVTSRDEIGQLMDIFNAMVRGVREKEHIKATFGQYLDPRIVDDLVRRSGNGLDEGSRRVMTVFFSDVAKFSTISEMLTPGGLVTLINHYLTLVTDPIIRHYGVIDKFIGDAVVAFWGAPYANEEAHAALACEAALEQFVQLDTLRRRMPDLMGFRKGLPNVTVRIGLATGTVLVGNVGSSQTKSYTVLGPAAKMAEELEEANKALGTRILLAEETRQLAQSTMETRSVDRLRIGEGESPVPVFELLSRKGELAADMADMRDTFEAGLDLYWNQDWDRAQKQFETCLQMVPEDGPARVYLQRVQTLRATPPGPDWDGVWV